MKAGMIFNQIRTIIPEADWTLCVVFVDGVQGVFDVNPYLTDEAFEDLRDINEFMKVHNGGYYIEWECGADLSADTLRERIKKTRKRSLSKTV